MRIPSAALLFFLSPLVACAAGEGGHADAALQAQASIGVEQARTLALATRPGEIREWELEQEAGGSGLRYSFVIRAPAGGDFEVGVDAKDGAILENAAEGAHPD